jgi:hypothetical protein
MATPDRQLVTYRSGGSKAIQMSPINHQSVRPSKTIHNTHPTRSPIQTVRLLNDTKQFKETWLNSQELIIMNCKLNSNVIVVNGTIDNWPAKSLLDSGASGNFLTRQFVIEANIQTTPMIPKLIRLADGKLLKANEAVIDTDVEIKGKIVKNSFIVLDQLNNGNDAILGIPWLEKADPVISFKNRTISFKDEPTQQIGNEFFKPMTNQQLNQFSVYEVNHSTRTSTESELTKQSANRKQRRLKLLNPLPLDLSSLIKSEMWDNEVELEPGDIILMINLTEIQEQPNNQIPISQLNKVTVEQIIEQLPLVAKSIVNEYQDVFPEELPQKLPQKREADLRINLIPGSAPPTRAPYRMSTIELAELKQQLDKLLGSGFIKPSLSPYGAPVLFVRKKTGELRMCIDYRALNKITIKNSYGLPRISELLDQIRGANYFTTLDLNSGYHQLRVHQNDTQKTAFRTRYGLYEFTVVPFGLTGAPAAFMKFVQFLFHHLLDQSVVVFVDDILIYSKTEIEHRKHVKEVLDILRKNELYAKLPKCQLFQSKVTFLGHVLSKDGLSVEADKIKAMNEWPRPQNRKHILSFLGLCGYYRTFIENFSQIALPMTELLKETREWKWDEREEESFRQLQQAMSKAPVLASPDPTRNFIVTTDASDFAIGAALSQQFDCGNRPIAFYSKKLSPAESNYPVHEKELLAVIQALKEWRCFLDGQHFTVITDHKSLIYLQTQPHLSHRQVRWLEFLSLFNFTIQYKPGKTNLVADALSRRHDHEPLGSEVSSICTLGTSELYKQIVRCQLDDETCQQVIKGQIPSENESDLKSREGVVFKNNRILVPPVYRIKAQILKVFHDSPVAGHAGTEKTTELIKRELYWHGMDREIKDYVTSCDLCQRNKPSQQLPMGLLKPLEIPKQAWDTITMDFITQLPRTKSGYDSIAVVVDKLSKMVHLIPTHTNVTAPQFAMQFIKEIVRLHGVPRHIISDRDSKFTSHFWRHLMKCLGVELRLSTSFHPQTDGQTERANRTLETILRNFVNQRNNNWDEFLATTEIAINNAKQASTKFSPFYLNYGYHMNLPFLNHKHSGSMDSPTVPAADEMFKSIRQATEQAMDNLMKAQETQSFYANQKRRDEQFKIGEQVYLSTENLPIVSGVSKLNPKYIGPFKIIKIINSVTVKLHLPPTKNIVNSFHVSRLKKVNTSQLFPERSFTQPEPIIVNNNDSSLNEWEVEEIIGRRINHRRVEYLVRWKNCGVEENSWEPVSNLTNSIESVREFERKEIELNRRRNHNNRNDAQVNSTVNQTLRGANSTTIQNKTTNKLNTNKPQVRINSIRVLTAITPISNPHRIEQSLQCSARIKKGKGRRCRNRTLKSGMCQQHLQSQVNLNIKQSKVQSAGFGLFTGGKSIRKGETVTPYTGQVSDVPISGTYVLQCTKKHFIDANRSIDVGGYVNECKRRDRERGECEGNNARLTYNSKRKEVNVIATRTIAPRKEVYLPYGIDYWSKLNNVRVKTKKE